MPFISQMAPQSLVLESDEIQVIEKNLINMILIMAVVTTTSQHEKVGY
jgi:hypothetical protein